MTAQQAAARGQGKILVNSNIPRVYNLCLEGGGNILINTSSNDIHNSGNDGLPL